MFLSSFFVYYILLWACSRRIAAGDLCAFRLSVGSSGYRKHLVPGGQVSVRSMLLRMDTACFLPPTLRWVIAACGFERV